MSSHDGRRHVVICSHLDKIEVVLRRVERFTEILVPITRNVVTITAQAVKVTRHAVWILAMVYGFLTCSGSLRQVVGLLE